MYDTVQVPARVARVHDVHGIMESSVRRRDRSRAARILFFLKTNTSNSS